MLKVDYPEMDGIAGRSNAALNVSNGRGRTCPPEQATVKNSASKEEPLPNFSWCDVNRSIPAVRNVRSIDLDVTEACNLGCIYCFKWQKKAVNMSEETAKAAIDWLLEASGDYRGELKVNLMGGEPTLRFDLIQKIVPYGKCRARQRGKNMHFGCTTNCTRITDELMDFWRRYGMGFHCSIDGIPEVQNANRPLLGGGKSSTLLEKNVGKILAYRPEVMARATVTPKSAPFLLESALYIARLGFTHMTFKPAVNVGWDSSTLSVLRQQYEKLGALYIDRLLSENPLHIEEFDGGLQALYATNSKHGPPCGAGNGLTLIDPRGEMYPCHRFGPHLCGGQFCFGRLGGEFNDRLRGVFLGFDTLSDTQAGCSDCRAAIVCHAWCYVECVDAKLSLYSPGEDYCELRRMLYDQVVNIRDYLRLRHPNILRRVVHDVLAAGATQGRSL